MNLELTLTDVEQKYHYVIEHMDFCRDAALSDEFPTHATWLHPPTLARWLYGSILEFALEYDKLIGKLKNRTHNQNTQLLEWGYDVIDRLQESKIAIGKKYPEIAGELRI